MAMLKINIAILVSALGLYACQAPPEAVTEFDPSYIEVGQDIAETQCAVCHNIGTSGASPREDAPPLRTVFKRYNPESLADDFREHIHVGHPDMPDFDFTVLETEGLLAYLRSIQDEAD